MKIECGEFIEQEDGSAICQVDLDIEAKEYLINLGFLELLKTAIRENKIENPAT